MSALASPFRPERAWGAHGIGVGVPVLALACVDIHEVDAGAGNANEQLAGARRGELDVEAPEDFRTAILLDAYGSQCGATPIPDSRCLTPWALGPSLP